jgi:hypothetical protein
MFPYAALRPNQVHNPSFSLIKLSKSEYLSIYQSYQFGVGVCGSGVRRYGLERGVFRENPRPLVLHAITHGGQDFSRRTPTPERSNLFGSSARGGGFIT